MNGLIRRLPAMRLPEHVKAQASRIVSSVSHPLVQFKGLQLDQGLLKFTLYLFEADGAMMSAVFHELYHKWQFSVSKPLYVANLVMSLLMGYGLSSKCALSIEGDVRRFVDNDGFHSRLSKFYSVLYSFLFIRSRLTSEEPGSQKAEGLMAQLDALKASEGRFYSLCERLLEMMKAA